MEKSERISIILQWMMVLINEVAESFHLASTLTPHDSTIMTRGWWEIEIDFTERCVT